VHLPDAVDEDLRVRRLEVGLQEVVGERHLVVDRHDRAGVGDDGLGVVGDQVGEQVGGGLGRLGGAAQAQPGVVADGGGAVDRGQRDDVPVQARLLAQLGHDRAVADHHRQLAALEPL